MSTETFEFSEFSIYEILYMASEPLTYVVNTFVDDSARDPFELVAEREEAAGRPLALMIKGVNDM